MAWKRLTEEDFASALSQREIDAFRASPAVSGISDPVAMLLASAAGQVRACVRACTRASRAVRMAPDELSVPQSLVRAALALCAYDALKRLPAPVGEDRRAAKDDALALLREVAAGRVIPENDGEEDTATTGAGAVWDESARFLAD